MKNNGFAPGKKIYKNHILKIEKYMEKTYRFEKAHYKKDWDIDNWRTITSTSASSSYYPIIRRRDRGGWVFDGYKTRFSKQSHCGLGSPAPLIRVRNIGRKWSSICKRCLVIYHKNKYNVNFLNKSRDTQIILDQYYNQIMTKSFRF